MLEITCPLQISDVFYGRPHSVYGDQNQNNYVQRPGGSGRRPVYQPGGQRPLTSVGRNGRVIQHSDEGHNADIIHNRLLDLLDPAKHMHPGKPSDPRIPICTEFLSAFFLMSSMHAQKHIYLGKQDLVCSKNSERNSHHNS